MEKSGYDGLVAPVSTSLPHLDIFSPVRVLLTYIWTRFFPAYFLLLLHHKGQVFLLASWRTSNVHGGPTRYTLHTLETSPIIYGWIEKLMTVRSSWNFTHRKTSFLAFPRTIVFYETVFHPTNLVFPLKQLNIGDRGMSRPHSNFGLSFVVCLYSRWPRVWPLLHLLTPKPCYSDTFLFFFFEEKSILLATGTSVGSGTCQSGVLTLDRETSDQKSSAMQVTYVWTSCGSRVFPIIRTGTWQDLVSVLICHQ